MSIRSGGELGWRHLETSMCCEGSEKGRRGEKAAGDQEAHFINHSRDLVGNVDSCG